ncbi:CheR family methyltransferase [Thermospira aquatica]|uniref:protein-glutamate O-methyltransferase n=1 Tax=Thermospira aquatica TaxID=2828656 RepID=A0AAX3BDR0_9SPIR|nr:protein-glutamate O-methyltransferase CheR [Thermospira aquatica]URA10365.1 protein-glutamate O-methyltransferase CheR [Thermospira aquatica]
MTENESFFQIYRLSDRDFELISHLVYDTVGIYLPPEKKILVESRLQQLLKQENIQSFDELYQRIVRDPNSPLLSDLINRLTTNHTYFMRESAHYDYMVQVLFPQWKTMKQRDIRIWSAGCSSGEEIYTIAILIREHFSPFIPDEWGLLGTDISLRVLTQAEEGKYLADRLENLDPSLIQRYFIPIDDTSYQLLPEIRSMVLFKRFNLMNETYPFKGKFDIIWCRNVLIYFDQAHKDFIISHLVNVLKPGGYLFVGHSETIEREKYQLTFIQPAIYQKEAL